MGEQISWFGIDFGTTNSAASVFYGPDVVSAVQSDFGDDLGRPFPSLVGINRNTGEVITGREARDSRNELSEQYQFFSSIKTVLDKDVTYTVAGKKWTPVDIAAEIFKGLRKRIRERSEGMQDCSEAVVAVPVAFAPAKKEALRRAAKKAGIEIKMFVSEPTAAYCSNYVNLKSCSNVAVFDWGGGTLDISILRIEGGKVFELETNGMNVAGDDIDRKIAEKLHAEICMNKGLHISFEELSNEAKDELLMRSEDAKIKLSTGEDVVSIRVLKGPAGISRVRMTYDYFSKLIDPEVTNAVQCLEDTIQKAGLNDTSIDRILCVGGSSKLGPLQEKLKDNYGESKLYYPSKVMWDISRGASVISMSSGGYGLNQDIGLMLCNHEFYPLLLKGQRLPCRENQVNFAITDDEKTARFIITDEKQSFMKEIIVPAGGFMAEQFEVSCFIDPDMLLRLRIRSTRYQEQYLCVWTYDHLKIYYDLGGADDESDE